MKTTIEGVAVGSDVTPGQAARVLTPEAVRFLAELHQKFNGRRLELLAARTKRAAAIRGGALPDFLKETASVRASEWQVGPTPKDLADRRVEITGPAEAKMMINALNCGAKAFMCDFEDSLSPTFTNVIDGQAYLQDAVRRTLSFTNEAGKKYTLNPQIATLLVRPRGWHLPEKHLKVGGEPMSGSLTDFGLAFFHNAKEQTKRGTGPYFYLPKMESHLEARLWNDVFDFAQQKLGIPAGTIKVTVLIETILAAYEMDEILFELKDHITGLNAGRWDYIFSTIKKFAHDQTRIFPDRGHVTMAVPFMRAYCELLVQTCHKRGAHAMGGMAAFIPSRKDEAVNKVALAKVKEDKEREASLGFDGTWIAHPDLLPVAQEAFDRTFGAKPNQKDKPLSTRVVKGAELIDTKIEGSKITEAGVANNIDVALQYVDHWLKGTGAVAIYNLMEDAATAEISRAQLWQWVRHGAKLDDGRPVTAALYQQLRERELAKLEANEPGRLRKVAEILDGLVLSADFGEFLTLPAYALLER